MGNNTSTSTKRAALFVLLVLGYALAVHTGTALIVPAFGVSALWLPTGLAIGVMVRQPLSRWVPLLVTFSGIAAAVRAFNDLPIETVASFVAADAVNILVATTILRALLKGRSSFERPSGIISLFLATAAGSLASAPIAIFGLKPLAGAPVIGDATLRAILLWFVGRGLGGVIMISAIDAWRPQKRLIKLSFGRRIEAIVVTIAVIVTGGVGTVVPQAGTLLAIALGGFRTLAIFAAPFRYGRRVTATLMGVLVFEFVALLVTGQVSIFGVALVEVASPETISPGIGVLESILSIVTIEGLVLGLAALVHERRLTSARIAADEDRFRAITESSTEALVEMGLDGVITFGNPAAHSLFGVEDLTGIEASRFVAVPMHLLFEDLRGDLLSHVSRTVEGVGRRGDGSTFPSEESWWSYATASGKVSLTVIIRDRTEQVLESQQQKLAAAELERSNKDLAEFAYIASHDLQEPLRMVASFLRLLQDRYKGQLDDDADQYIGYAMDGAERLNTLVADLLAYSRAGTVALERRDVDLDTLVDESLDLLRMQVREAGAQVTVGELGRTRGNASLIGQVLQNLISNSLKFHAPGEPPRIEISSDVKDGELVISVADHGIGVPAEMKDQVFQPFRRLHAREAYSGNGIGLAVCRKVVERHGGSIWMEETPGGGTTVCFSLPADISRRSRPEIAGVA